MRLAIFLIIPWWLCACGLTPREREVIDLTRQAGEVAARDPKAEPATRQAGSDVAANMATISAEHGAPDVPVTYTPAVAADARRALAAEYAAPPAAVGFLGGLADRVIPGASALAAAAWAIWKTVQARREGAALAATLHGIEGVLAEAEPVAREKMEAGLAKAHAVAGVKTHVRRRLAKLGFAKPA